jgi:parvulin-like peptidyl-prolyl isomerase
MRGLLPLSLIALFLLHSISRAALVDGVAVLVNDAIITYQDIELYVSPYVDLLERQYRNQPEVLEKKVQETRQDGLQQLLERQLILHEFKTAGYNLPESYLDDVIKERIKKKFGDRVSMTKTLREEGITYETYRQRIREEIIVDALRQKHVSQEILISPQKIERYYAQHTNDFQVNDQVKMRQIILNKPPTASAEGVRKVGQEILAKLDDGVPFAEMASVYSDGANRAQGGDYDWTEPSKLRKEIAAVVAGLKPGQRSGLIETPEAFFIFLVENKRPAHVKALSEVREEIERNLRVEEIKRLEKQWIDRLKKKSFIAYF